MSLMTSFVQIWLRPRMFRLDDVVSISLAIVLSASGSLMDDELSLARFELIVVVELLATDELLELGRHAQAVDAELALDQLGVGSGPLPWHAVEPERLHLAGHIEGPVVHRVAEVWPDVAADDLPAALHHECRIDPGVAEDDDGAALLVDAGPGPDAALDQHVPTADRGRRERPGVLFDHDHPRHHVLAGRPSDSPGDDHLRPIDHAEAEVPEAALKPDATPGQDADADGVLGAGVAHCHLGHALLVEEPAQFQVDLAGGQLGGVEPGRLTGDLRDLGNGRERLGQPSGVVGDASRAGRFYSDHTRTWLSYGS